MTIYGFNIPQLEVGDILLTRGAKPHSKAIAAATGGRFSHALLYVGNSAIEAMPEGVYSKNPQRLTFQNQTDLSARRLKRGLTDAEKDALSQFSRLWVGALYSIPEATATIAIGKAKKEAIAPGLQFCSRLVAQAYANAGINIVGNSDYCSPNDFVRSAQLDDVADAVAELSPEQIAFAKTEDYNLELQSATFQWLKKVRALAKRRGLGPIVHQADVGRMLSEHPGYDKVVSQYVRDSGYLDHHDVDRGPNPYRYSVPALLDLCKGEVASIAELIRREQEILDSNVQRRQQNYEAALENYRRLPLTYFLQEVELQERLLNELDTWRSTLSQARALVR